MQLINLVLEVFLLIANSKHTCTDSQRSQISFKGKICAILSPYLAEHNLLTVQPIFVNIFLLIRRSCVLCLTINFFALLIDRAAAFFNTVLVCKSGLWQSPRSMSCCAVGWLQAAIQPMFMKFCLELEEVVYFAL